jgi:ribosomal-protein-alanine N-acetyltransferase
LGEAVGFILTWQAGGDAEILTVAVSPSRRRKGVGRALLDGAIAQCRADGAGRMFLEVAASNAAARALYRSLGFFETGRRKGYYHRAGSPAEDALVLGRTL